MRRSIAVCEGEGMGRAPIPHSQRRPTSSPPLSLSRDAPLGRGAGRSCGRRLRSFFSARRRADAPSLDALLRRHHHRARRRRDRSVVVRRREATRAGATMSGEHRGAAMRSGRGGGGFIHTHVDFICDARHHASGSPRPPTRSQQPSRLVGGPPPRARGPGTLVPTDLAWATSWAFGF